MIKTLQELLCRHPMFDAEPLETKEKVLSSIRLKGTRTEYLVIRDGDTLLFVFNLVADAQRFSEASTIKHAVRKKLSSPFSHEAYKLLIRAVELDISQIDAESMVQAIATVAAASKLQLLVPRLDDAPWVSKLRKYNQASGEWELQTATKELLDSIDDTNVDLVMSSVADMDPWVDQDAENPLGTKLILLTELVQQHLISNAHARMQLKHLREEYVKLDGNWRAEMDEIEHLLSLAV